MRSRQNAVLYTLEQGAVLYALEQGEDVVCSSQNAVLYTLEQGEIQDSRLLSYLNREIKTWPHEHQPHHSTQ